MNTACNLTLNDGAGVRLEEHNRRKKKPPHPAAPRKAAARSKTGTITYRHFMFFVILAAGGCHSWNNESPPLPETSTEKKKTTEEKKTLPAEVVRDGEHLERPATPENDLVGIHNLLKISDRIYSGSQPDGEPAFGSLKRLGIRTIVSVDGATPQIDLAHENGLRYVHIPIGYDGIPKSACDSLTRVLRDVQGPIYIHCHHGKHRGPAAAAVALIASGNGTGIQALQILEQAGTSRNYAGLWRDVENFVPPEPDVSLPELVESAEVSSLVKTMAEIDRRFDRVKLCRKQDWKTPPENPEWQVLEELLLIKEAFTETNRHLSQDFDEPFAQLLAASEAATSDLMTAIESHETTNMEESFLRMEKTCQQCHRQYRDH